jgi:hypothetical protein
MRTLALAFALIALMFVFFACNKEVRYSPSELDKFPPEIQSKIRSGEVSLGMTPEMVRYAWGAPSEVNVLKPTADGKLREEWVYENLLQETSLIFTDRVLTEIATGKAGKAGTAPQNK